MGWVSPKIGDLTQVIAICLSSLAFPVASLSPSLALPTCPPPPSTRRVLASTLNRKPTRCRVTANTVFALTLSAVHQGVGYFVGAQHACLFDRGNWCPRPLLLVAVYRPLMTPTVPCVVPLCIALFRPPVLSYPPRKAPAVDHHM
jgi:hypothetical protein